MSTKVATEKQQEFIKALLRDRDVDELTRLKIGDPSTLARDAASSVISFLTLQPRLAKFDGVTEVGPYQKDGSIYQVRKSRTSGRLYAKVFDPVERAFFYDASAIRDITDADRMTLEQATLFGVQYGMCAHCAADLTDPASIERGYGPVCASKFARV